MIRYEYLWTKCCLSLVLIRDKTFHVNKTRQLNPVMIIAILWVVEPHLVPEDLIKRTRSLKSGKVVLIYIIMLDIIMLDIIMLDNIMLDIIMLEISLLNVILMNAILLNAILLNAILWKCHSDECPYA